MRAAARCADALAISISLSAVSDFSDLLLRSCLVPAASLVLVLDTLIPLPSRANGNAMARSSWILVLLFHPASARLASISAPPSACASPPPAFAAVPPRGGRQVVDVVTYWYKGLVESPACYLQLL